MLHQQGRPEFTLDICSRPTQQLPPPDAALLELRRPAGAVKQTRGARGQQIDAAPGQLGSVSDELGEAADPQGAFPKPRIAPLIFELQRQQALCDGFDPFELLHACTLSLFEPRVVFCGRRQRALSTAALAAVYRCRTSAARIYRARG